MFVSRRRYVLELLHLVHCIDEPCQSPTLDAVALTHISMPNTPTYILYHGRNTGKDKAGKKIWTRIGAVWPNKSGKGFNLTWDYLPLGDGLTVMLPFDKQEQDSHLVP